VKLLEDREEEGHELNKDQQEKIIAKRHFVKQLDESQKIKEMYMTCLKEASQGSESGKFQGSKDADNDNLAFICA
jgi:hypothetical protein